MSAVAVAEGVAYLASRSGPSGLLTIDISEPSRPTLLATHDVSALCVDVAVDGGGIVYLAGNEHGLTIVDASDPENPITIGQDVAPDRSHAVAIANGIVALAYPEQILIIDATDPSAPSMVGSWDVAGGVDCCFDATGGYLFVAGNEDGLWVLDVEDPTRPTLLSQTYPLGRFVQVVCDETTLFVGDAWSGLIVYDVSDPAAPAVLEYRQQRGGSLIAHDGGVIASMHESKLIIETWSESDGFTDVATLPSIFGVQDLVISGGRAITISDHQLQVFALSDQGTIEIDQPSGNPFGGSLVDVEDLGDRALVIAQGDLHLVTTDCPDDPQFIRTFTSSVEQYFMVRGGDTVGVVGRPYQIEWLDVADPASPRRVGATELPADCGQLAVGPMHAYASIGGELAVIDLTDFPEAPVVANTGIECGALVTWDGWLAVISGVYLRVYSLADPAAPIEVGALQLDDHYAGVYQLEQVGQRLLAVGDSYREIDVSSPEQPTLLIETGFGERIDGFAQADGLAYVAVDRLGLQLLDIGIPGEPRLVGTAVAESRLQRLHALSRFLWLDMDGQLGIAWKSCSASYSASSTKDLNSW